MRQKEYPLRSSISYQLPEFHVVFVPRVGVIFYVEKITGPRNAGPVDCLVRR
jgi:hypothetical protein